MTTESNTLFSRDFQFISSVCYRLLQCCSPFIWGYSLTNKFSSMVPPSWPITAALLLHMLIAFVSVTRSQALWNRNKASVLLWWSQQCSQAGKKCHAVSVSLSSVKEDCCKRNRFTSRVLWLSLEICLRVLLLSVYSVYLLKDVVIWIVIYVCVHEQSVG